MMTLFVFQQFGIPREGESFLIRDDQYMHSARLPREVSFELKIDRAVQVRIFCELFEVQRGPLIITDEKIIRL